MKIDVKLSLDDSFVEAASKGIPTTKVASRWMEVEETLYKDGVVDGEESAKYISPEEQSDDMKYEHRKSATVLSSTC